MKKVLIILLILIPSFVFAGEKEELTWQQKYYQEVIERIQTQFIMLKRDFLDAQDKLKETNKKLEELTKGMPNEDRKN